MNSFVGLCRREWLEHRGGFLWAPASVAAVIVVAVVLVLMIGQLDMARVDLDLDLSEAAGSDVELRIEGEDTSILDLVDGWLANHEWTDEELSAHLSGLLRGVAEPFHYVYFIVLVFVLLGALHDDRKDRTVLFWKSMPVTDAETVLSKLVTGVWVAPAATIATILAVQIFLLTVISGLAATRETLSIWPIWANSGLFIGLVELLVGYLIQGLWALPLYGWLLFVSAAVNRLPFLWALLAPAALVALEALVGLTSAARNFIHDHLGFRALPRGHGGEDTLVHAATGLGDSIALFATADLWAGIAVGAAFLAGTVHLRRTKNEI
ncbi:MAG: hypothetical protein F4149_13040 [Gammaproteobacteria bacterium]|nr:hypothetical protein [Gammaproteobacteria bacterium]MYK81202.1 hypothetical protein [Gammaproteobacteria bacterium]